MYNILMDLSAAEVLLDALGQHLHAMQVTTELVVCGGVGLHALGVTSRGTKDVDLIAVRTSSGLRSARPLPPPLQRARALVARDFGLSEDWLDDRNAQFDSGMPDGWENRLISRDYGSLVVHYLGRLDQIHLKLYALADKGPSGRHDSDLRALSPTQTELLDAARWLREQDPSDAFRGELLQAHLPRSRGCRTSSLVWPSASHG